MLKRLWSRWTLLALTLLVVPVVALADYFSPGHPCRAERTTYYSDASYNTVVGVDEYVCWQGHYVSGTTSNYYIHQDLGECCEVCTSTGVCGIQP